MSRNWSQIFTPLEVVHARLGYSWNALARKMQPTVGDTVDRTGLIEQEASTEFGGYFDNDRESSTSGSLIPYQNADNPIMERIAASYNLPATPGNLYVAYEGLKSIDGSFRPTEEQTPPLNRHGHGNFADVREDHLGPNNSFIVNGIQNLATLINSYNVDFETREGTPTSAFNTRNLASAELTSRLEATEYGTRHGQRNASVFNAAVNNYKELYHPVVEGEPPPSIDYNNFVEWMTEGDDENQRWRTFIRTEEKPFGQRYTLDNGTETVVDSPDPNVSVQETTDSVEEGTDSVVEGTADLPEGDLNYMTKQPLEVNTELMDEFDKQPQFIKDKVTNRALDNFYNSDDYVQYFGDEVEHPNLSEEQEQQYLKWIIQEYIDPNKHPAVDPGDRQINSAWLGLNQMEFTRLWYGYPADVPKEGDNPGDIADSLIHFYTEPAQSSPAHWGDNDSALRREILEAQQSDWQNNWEDAEAVMGLIKQIRDRHVPNDVAPTPRDWMDPESYSPSTGDSPEIIDSTANVSDTAEGEGSDSNIIDSTAIVGESVGATEGTDTETPDVLSDDEKEAMRERFEAPTMDPLEGKWDWVEDEENSTPLEPKGTWEWSIPEELQRYDLLGGKIPDKPADDKLPEPQIEKVKQMQTILRVVDPPEEHREEYIDRLERYYKDGKLLQQYDEAMAKNVKSWEAARKNNTDAEKKQAEKSEAQVAADRKLRKRHNKRRI